MTVFKFALCLWAAFLAPSKKTSSETALFPFTQDGKWGFIDRSGETVVEAKFAAALPSSEGIARVWDENGRVGYVRSSGKVIVPPKYETGFDFQGGLARVTMEGKTGFINRSGKLVVKCKYDEAHDVSERRAWVRSGENIGFVNNEGETAIKPRFVWADDFHDGLALIRTDGSNGTRYGYLLRSGKWYVAPKYVQARCFSESMAAVITEPYGKWGYIDGDKNLAVSNRFEEARDFHEGRAAVRWNYRWGFINKKGEWVVPAEYEEVADFSGGLARVKTGGLWGYVNREGKIIAEPQFAAAGDIQEGMAEIVRNGERGVINSEGEFKTDPRIERVYPARDGLARIRVQDKYGFIAPSGKFAVDLELDGAGNFRNGLALVARRGKDGYETAYIRGNGKTVWKSPLRLSRPYETDEVLYVTAPERQASTNKRASSGMDMWKQADTGSKKIVTLAFREKVVAIENPRPKPVLIGDGMLGHWLKVEYNGTKGYVFDAFLLPVPLPDKGQRLEEYFERKLGVLNPFDPAGEPRCYGGGISMRKLYMASQWESLFRIPDMSLQDVFQIMRVSAGFPTLSLPQGSGSLKLSTGSIAVTAQWVENELERVSLSFSGDHGTGTMEAWRDNGVVMVREKR